MTTKSVGGSTTPQKVGDTLNFNDKDKEPCLQKSIKFFCRKREHNDRF